MQDFENEVEGFQKLTLKWRAEVLSFRTALAARVKGTKSLFRLQNDFFEL